MKNSLEEFIDCENDRDIQGKMGAAGFAGALIGTYAGGGAISPVTAVAFGVVGMALGAIPTSLGCVYDVVTSSPQLGLPKVAVPAATASLRK